MLHIANPIYDSAFKYLMEDERIAKTLIGALIKRTSEQLNKQSEQLNKQSEQLNKQSEQLNKQSEQLRAAIRMLHSPYNFIF